MRTFSNPIIRESVIADILLLKNMTEEVKTLPTDWVEKLVVEEMSSEWLRNQFISKFVLLIEKGWEEASEHSLPQRRALLRTMFVKPAANNLPPYLQILNDLWLAIDTLNTTNSFWEIPKSLQILEDTINNYHWINRNHNYSLAIPPKKEQAYETMKQVWKEETLTRPLFKAMYEPWLTRGDDTDLDDYYLEGQVSMTLIFRYHYILLGLPEFLNETSGEPQAAIEAAIWNQLAQPYRDMLIKLNQLS